MKKHFTPAYPASSTQRALLSEFELATVLQLVAVLFILENCNLGPRKYPKKMLKNFMKEVLGPLGLKRFQKVFSYFLGCFLVAVADLENKENGAR